MLPAEQVEQGELELQRPPNPAKIMKLKTPFKQKRHIKEQSLPAGAIG